MKNTFRILLFTILLLGVNQVVQAQGTVNGSVQADGKLLFFGDEARGIDAGTPHILTKVKLTGNQGNIGYLYVAPTFEYAKLPYENYYRWQAEVGYTFNQWLENFESSLYISYGTIKRGLTSQSYGFGGTLGYKITDNIKTVADLQVAHRTDFRTLYNTDAELRYSVLVGIEIVIFDTNKHKRR